MPKIFGFYQIQRQAQITLAGLLILAVLGSGTAYVQAYYTLKPIYEVKTEERILALSFDISWGNKTPLPVLEILKENDLRCTFFLSGPWVKEYPEIVQRIKEDGHEIGSHGYRHIDLSNLSKTEIKEEISKTHQIIKAGTGVEAKLIRTPNGDYSNHVIEAIHESGYEAIQWGTDSLDWTNPGVDSIIDRVCQQAHPGDIILMHASDTCKQTAEALPVIIKNLKEQGYKMITVSELLKEDKAGIRDNKK
ncbi:MAG: polysaccharide deacetylase family sporulation protein PdaB [Syntrophomonadaceae bacterium]|nr:polysaccharide deacetylase family sporulation protein PdaB [Syntrophomonadaceae bacterium]